MEERNKTVPICRWHDCLHRNLKESKKPRTSEFSKVAEYKINIQKSIGFLYISKEHMSTKIKNTIPFTIAQQN